MNAPASKKRVTKKRSKWWKHYEEIEKGKKAKCNLCGKEVVVAGGTSNLKTHLQSKHFSEYFELNNSNETASVFNEEDEDDVSGDDSISIASSPSASPSPTPARSPSPATSTVNAMSPPPSPLPPG